MDSRKNPMQVALDGKGREAITPVVQQPR